MPFDVFISYSHQDKALQRRLVAHLSNLKNQEIISDWYDGDISPGTEWRSQVVEHLDTANIILLLISANFMASDFCFSIEMKRAIARHNQNQACIIPIILRSTDWKGAPFEKLKVLPTDGKPITKWVNRDDAFTDVVLGIKQTIDVLRERESSKPPTNLSEATIAKPLDIIEPKKQVNTTIALTVPVKDITDSQLDTDQSFLPASANQLLIPPCPYLGLSAFQEEQTTFFFGREADTNALANAVHRNSFVPILGASGSGKSSLVFAGLVPLLRLEEKWLVIGLRPGDHPLQSLVKALVPSLEGETSGVNQLVKRKALLKLLQEDEQAFCDIVEQIIEQHPGNRLLLIIDQFEEVYTLCRNGHERQLFLNGLVNAVQPIPDIRTQRFNFVITLRADFLGRALSSGTLSEALQRSNNFNLGPMNRQRLRDAIEKPAQKLNVKIQEGLTERILDAVGQKAGNLPLLEFTLTLLWEKQQENNLTHTIYDEIGGVEQSLSSYAERVFHALSSIEQVQARRIFIQLVRPGEGTEDTRRIAIRAEIGEENWPLVVRLANARLVVTGRSDTSKEETVEVVHEALIKVWGRLQNWMEQDRKFRVWQERLRTSLRQWENSNKDTSALLRGVLLEEAKIWLEKRPNDLSATEKVFIQMSVPGITIILMNLNEVLGKFLLVLEWLLVGRFIFRFIGVDPNNLFAGFLYALTDIFLFPFITLLHSSSIHKPYQATEFSTLITCIIYYLIFVGIRNFLPKHHRILRNKSLISKISFIFKESDTKRNEKVGVNVQNSELFSREGYASKLEDAANLADNKPLTS